MPRYVINPKSSATIKFAATEGGLAAGTDGSFQITSFRIVHSPENQTVAATFGDIAFDSLNSTKFSLQIEYLQDWGVNAASLSEYLWNNRGETVWFEITPTGDIDTVKGMKGTVEVPGTDYGGRADEVWIASVTLNCVTVPTLVADT